MESVTTSVTITGYPSCALSSGYISTDNTPPDTSIVRLSDIEGWYAPYKEPDIKDFKYIVYRKTKDYSMIFKNDKYSYARGFYNREAAINFLQEDWERTLNNHFAARTDIDMRNSFHEDDLAVIADRKGKRVFWWIESKEKEKEKEMPTKLTGETFSLTGTFCMKPMLPKIKEVIFNNPATIVLWEDGTKTVVKVKKREKYDKWVGLAMCHMKKYYGEKFHKTFRDYCEEKR